MKTGVGACTWNEKTSVTSKNEICVLETGLSPNRYERCEEMLELQFGGIFDEPRPMTGTILHQVNISLSETFDDMARFEVEEMKRVTRYQQNAELPEVEDMERYLKTLIHVRVLQVTDPRQLKEYKSSTYSARVPARVSLLLDNIGEAYDFESNIRFIPTYSIDSDNLMSPEEIVEMSLLMERYLAEGYTTIQGIKKDKTGSIYLMSKLVVNTPDNLQKVLSYRKDNPVYAFFASMLKLEILKLNYEDIIMAYRVQYSDELLYKARFPEYYREIGKADSKGTED